MLWLCIVLYCFIIFFVFSLPLCNYFFFCADIDECERGEHQCSQHCQNSVGSYLCYCDPGFVLAANGLDCEGNCVRSLSACAV